MLVVFYGQSQKWNSGIPNVSVYGLLFVIFGLMLFKIYFNILLVYLVKKISIMSVDTKLT